MSFLFPKIPKAPDPIPPVTRDDAIDQQNQDDAMLRRRGAGANALTGPFGAQAPGTGGAMSAGGKVLLGQG